MADTKSDELSLYNKWRKTGEKEDFQELYMSMKPLIYKAARNASYGSNIPESAHKAYAAQSFYDALRTFDPSKGGALGTHVFGSVSQKAKRLNYTYQNLGKIPEPRAAKVGLYQNEYSNLRDKLDREPSTSEMADQLGWGISEVSKIQREIQKDLALSEGIEEHAYIETPIEDERLDYLYPMLGSEAQNVYDYILGKHGKARMVKHNGRIDYDRIAERMGCSSSKVRSLHKDIVDKFKKEMQR